MLGKKKKVNDYFFFNNIKVKKNCNFFGSLEFGGLSNYWGLQIDKNIFPDISNLSKRTQKKIIQSFKELFKKYNLLGKVGKGKSNLFSQNKYFDEKFININKNLIQEEPVLAFQNKIKKKNRFKQIK